MKNPQRFYLPQKLISGQTQDLDSEQSHHCQVLRLRIQDSIKVYNEQDGEFAAKFLVLNPKKSQIQIQDRLRSPQIPTKELTLAFALLQSKDKNDLIVEKACELGVHKIQALTSDYSQSHHFKIDRWQKILRHASQQSERLDIPRIEPLRSLKQSLEQEQQQGSEILICLERKDSQRLVNYLFQEKPSATKISLFLGPEGGFSENEQQFFVKNNLKTLSLGPQILRTETACLAALSLITNFTQM